MFGRKEDSFVKKDLAGQKFGRLTVIKPTEERYRRCVVWECVCDCGNICYKPSSHIGKHTFSCGCLHKQVVENNCKIDVTDGTKLGNLNEKLSKNNTSGVKGVSRHRDKWLARIKIQRKTVYLGVFYSIEDAVKARKKAEEEYYQPILQKHGKELKQ